MNLLKNIAIALSGMALSLSATAAPAVKGFWTKTPVSRPSSITQIAETPSAVYYVGGGSLHHYDRATGSVTLYGIDRGLNTDYTRFIRYNPEGKYLVAAMTDGLLNIIHDDGAVKQVNDIAAVRATHSTNINDVAFKDDKIYVATDFGIAEVDANTGRLTSTGVYSAAKDATTSISGGPSHIAIVGDWIYAAWSRNYAYNPHIYGAPLSTPLSSPEAWTKLEGSPVFTGATTTQRINGMFAAGPGTFVIEYLKGNGVRGQKYFIVTPDPATKSYTIGGKGQDAQDLQRAWWGGDHFYMLYQLPGDKKGLVLREYTSLGDPNPKTNYLFDTITPTFTTVSASTYAPTVWVSDENGLAGYEFAADGTRTMTVSPSQTALPGVHSTVANLSLLRPTPDGKSLVMSTRSGTSAYLENAGRNYNPDSEDAYNTLSLLRPGDALYDKTPINPTNIFLTEPAFFVPTYVNLLTADGNVADFSPKQALNRFGNTDIGGYWVYGSWFYQCFNQQRPILAIEGIDCNPKSATPELWVATSLEGIYRLRRNADTGEVEQKLYSIEQGTTPFGGWGNQTQDLRFDEEGNLWVVCIIDWKSTPIATDKSLLMLPADKVASGNFTKDDWIRPACVPGADSWRVRTESHLWLVNTDHGKYITVHPQRGVGQMIIYQRNGTGADTSTDKAWVVTSLTTQFGENVGLQYVNAMYPDSKGRLWIQTDRFFGYINDFSKLKAGDQSIAAVSVKLGGAASPSAEDVLPGEQIVGMSEAPDGTLWVATQTSGLYQLSADGTVVLEHYDSTNSPLPSDVLGSVAVLADGKVHVGTRHGLYTLTPGMSAAAATLDDVLVTPSPVPVGYHGAFTISNLTAGAQVKVTTSPVTGSGATVFEGRAAGGAVTWDGFTPDGSRVGPGTYYVHVAGQSSPVIRLTIVD